MNSSNNTAGLRNALIAALPDDPAHHTGTPETRHVYIPPGHIKALRLDCALVIGTRGVGKTFWSSALQSGEIRKMLGSSVANLEKVEVRPGFGIESQSGKYPDADTIRDLLGSHISPYDVWRAVLARCFGPEANRSVPTVTWKDTCLWVARNPEDFAHLLESAQERFVQQNSHGLIVFDSLDRTATDWTTMDALIKELLRVALLLKGFRRLHAKVFLRDDQYRPERIATFPDASKLLSTKVDLTWAPQDLHGLLWQYLLNAAGNHGEILRSLYQQVTSDRLQDSEARPWMVSDNVKTSDLIQKRLFEELAGSWMGRDHRRGIPYSWVVGHLADGKRQASPRSFIAAIKKAGEVSAERYSAHPHPLHYEGIKRGVQAASAIRVNEMTEDYPWISQLMAPLKGQTVPCDFGLIQARWDLRPELPQSLSSEGRLPPEHLENGWAGLRRDLESLGVFESMKDMRINMPDIFRVGFGLGRRGGVRPALPLGR
jgi:hypothetical protein